MNSEGTGISPINLKVKSCDSNLERDEKVFAKPDIVTHLKEMEQVVIWLIGNLMYVHFGLCIVNVLYYSVINMLQREFEEEYDVIKKIGEGWFSRIYLAEHRKTRQEVILKAVAIDQSNNTGFGSDYGDDSLEVNEQVKNEFLREYQNACSLSSHANILQVYDTTIQVGDIIRCT